jgi:Holliday junction DNA helicase RuvB
MAIERVIDGQPVDENEERANYSLRPRSLGEFVGQTNLVEKIAIALKAAKSRKEQAEHMLFHGPPGLGKTSLAHIIAGEMGTKISATSGPALARAGDLMGILTNLDFCDVLFIDEIHRLSATVEELIYPAMEDFMVDFVVDKGAYAKSIKIPLKPFTLIGATTRAGMLSAPLRERFGLFLHVDFYPVEDLEKILKRAAGLLQMQIDAESIALIARCARGTPRVANRLLRRVRDFAQVKSHGKVSVEIAESALKMEGVDGLGLVKLDRKMLQTIIEYYNGGPVGIEALAATLNEEVDTLVDVVEPYLLKIGFIRRTRQGRLVGPEVYEHLGMRKGEEPESGQPRLF